MSEFKDKVVVITGGAQGIGRCTAEMFRAQGAKVCVIDIQRKPEDLEVDLYNRGDISRENVLRDFADAVLEKFGQVDYLINNAVPLFKGIETCTYDEFNYALRVVDHIYAAPISSTISAQESMDLMREAALETVLMPASRSPLSMPAASAAFADATVGAMSR